MKRLFNILGTFLKDMLTIKDSRRKKKQDSKEKGKMHPDQSMLKKMVAGIVTTRDDEIGCDECFEQLDRFVELTLAEKNASEMLTLVQDHLNRCRDCREEFEALLSIVEHMNQ